MFRTLIAFGANDLKSIRRDSLLFSVMLIPWLLVLSLRLAIPPITEFLQTRSGFDLVPYYPLVVCFFVLLNVPLLFGVMTGFLMLDERDEDTLTALRVTPVALSGLIHYRMWVSFVLSALYIVITVPLTGLIRLEHPLQIVLPALLSALFAPVVTLFLVAFAKNKLEGFALMKGAGLILLGPMASFFVIGEARWLFGVLPTFWSLQAFVAALAQQPYAIYWIGGVIYHLVLIGVLYQRYQRQFSRSN